MHPFTAIFLFALGLSLLLRLWLAWRQMRHVRAHRGAVPREFAARVDLAAHRKAADYSVAKTRLGIAHALLETALALAFTLGGGLAALDGFWTVRIADPLWRGMALVFSAAALLAAAEIPLALYRIFGIEARFGFNRMTPAAFLRDLLKMAGLALALGIPLLLCALWLMEKTGSRWWVYVWLVWAAFNLLMVAIFPVFIAPLFNKFTPLPDGELKERIGQLAARCDFRTQGVFVMDGSQRSTHGNAFFAGFGRTRRIVFFDTLLARLAPGEIEAVLAHELGHFKLRHVIKRMAWGMLSGLALLAVLGHLASQDWFYSALTSAAPSNALALLLFSFAAPPFTLPLQPLSNHYSRRHEFEADAYAAQHADAEDLIRGLVNLYQDNAVTLTPDPLHSAFYDSHPPAALRVAHLQKLLHNHPPSATEETL